MPSSLIFLRQPHDQPDRCGRHIWSWALVCPARLEVTCLLTVDSTDECLKAASYMADAMFDPLYAQSGEPTKTALNLAFKTDLPVFDWFDTPGNEDRLSRFGITMDAARRVSAPEAVLHGEDVCQAAKCVLTSTQVSGGMNSLTEPWSLMSEEDWALRA